MLNVALNEKFEKLTNLMRGTQQSEKLEAGRICYRTDGGIYALFIVNCP